MLENAEAEGLSIFSQTLTMRGWNEFKATDWDIWNISPIWREFTFAGEGGQAGQAGQGRRRGFPPSPEGRIQA